MRQLASRRPLVVVADIDEPRAQAVAGTIPYAVAARLDVTRQDDTEALAERIERDHGPAAIVVTSAGVLQRPLPPEDL